MAITGIITFLVSRTQINGQLALAEKNAREQNARSKQQLYRDVYVQFLNQAHLVMRQLQHHWTVSPPLNPSESQDIVDLMNGLSAQIMLVRLEGPPQVGDAASLLHRQLDREIEELEKSFNKTTLRSDAQEPLHKYNFDAYKEISQQRSKAFTDAITAARKALGNGQMTD